MIIITSKYGYLGNQLLTFANAIAIAKRNNLTVMNFGFDEYADFFIGTGKDLFCRFPARESRLQPRKFLRTSIAKLFFNRKVWVQRIWVDRICSLFADVINLGWEEKLYFDDSARLEQTTRISSGKLTFISGYYLLDPSGLCEYAEEIRAYFKLNEHYQNRINEIMDPVKQECDVVVGVHFRQGDYKKFQNGLYYYSDEEYQSEMLKVQSLFPGQKVGFLVVSNERDQKRFSEDLLVFTGGGHIIEDMYCLAACDFIMGAPSTFSGWASFYGNTPRYVVNYKEEVQYGINRGALQLSDFSIWIPSAPETDNMDKLEEFKQQGVLKDFGIEKEEANGRQI